MLLSVNLRLYDQKRKRQIEENYLDARELVLFSNFSTHDTERQTDPRTEPYFVKLLRTITSLSFVVAADLQTRLKCRRKSRHRIDSIDTNRTTEPHVFPSRRPSTHLIRPLKAF